MRSACNDGLAPDQALSAMLADACLCPYPGLGLRAWLAGWSSASKPDSGLQHSPADYPGD